MHRLIASQGSLDQWITQLTDDDMRRPSLLPSWTVGHVLSHIALNAEAFSNVAAGLSLGEVGVMYPRGLAARNSEIDEASTRSAASIAGHVAASSAALVTTWSGLDDEALAGAAVVIDGMPEFAVATVVLRRLREVEVHQSDCGLDSFGHRQWSDGYVDWDLPGQWTTAASRLDVALVVADDAGERYSTGPQEEAAMMTVDRRDLLAWLLNRAQPDGLPDIGPWQ